MLFLWVVIDIPLLIFGIFEYKHIGNLNVEPNFCRVKRIEIKQELGKSSSRRKPIWIVDIVKESKNSDTTDDLIVLRPNLRIISSDGYALSSIALEPGNQLDSVS